MEQNEKLRALETLQKKLYAYNCASNSLYLDAVTVAPKNTAEGRGVALSILAGELQKLMTAPETLALVEELYARRETLDTLHRREVEELRRSCRQLTRIPAEEYMAYSELTNRASDVWHTAKEENDFASFCPILQELVEYNRRFAGYSRCRKLSSIWGFSPMARMRGTRPVRRVSKHTSSCWVSTPRSYSFSRAS